MGHRNFPARDGRRHTPSAPAAPAGIQPPDDLDALLAIAREAGLLVMLDGQIGREKYQSVAGSVLALQRFAAALRARADANTPAVAVAEPRRKARPGWPRLRNRTPGGRGRPHGVRRGACVCRITRRGRDQRTMRYV
ncbi:hypothetical protein [Burkholderia ambifaria]|jgi:hypothetical protein|uniref:hypothetical protein n=1 Tax=Burkholderia ambifaria TaxID=152480 RepID=UPI00158C4787|nr:hypothetical protein [Burkholderia ambifaria]MBR8252979.1 hypothetical protein [Burkholderia ambifaria]